MSWTKKRSLRVACNPLARRIPRQRVGHPAHTMHCENKDDRLSRTYIPVLLCCESSVGFSIRAPNLVSRWSGDNHLLSPNTAHPTIPPQQHQQDVVVHFQLKHDLLLPIQHLQHIHQLCQHALHVHSLQPRLPRALQHPPHPPRHPHEHLPQPAIRFLFP